MKRKYYPSITDRDIVLTILHGRTERDPRREGVLNSTMRIQPSGRRLRVAYRIMGPKRYMVITAFWIDK